MSSIDWEKSMVSPPKKQLLPLLLLISLFALSFFSHYRPFFHKSPKSSKLVSNLIPLDANKNLSPHNNQNFTFLIKVLAFNRLDSLSRCLNSLSNANYDGDTVHLHIYIDHFPFSNESSADLEPKLENSNGILKFVDGFHWKFGNKVVHYRTVNVGLQAQWLEAWWPSSDNEFAFVVEDDMEISPIFYRFVKTVIANFYYNATNYSPSVYGVSLQRPRFVPGKHGNKLQLDSGTKLFLYQLVGTWGQILFPKPWKEFRLWYDNHKSKGIKPFLDGMVTTGWYKRMQEKIWTPWFIKFIHSQGYYNIYTNLGHERALSVSHRDPGTNYGKTAGPDSQLVDESSFYPKFLDIPPLSDLKWYDFCFREVNPGRVVRSLNDFDSVLSSVQKHRTVMLVSIFGTPDRITRNLICHLEKLNIQKSIFMGPDSDFLYDLARRGQPVIDANRVFLSMKEQKLIRFRDSNSEAMETTVKAYVIQKCLEMNYNLWILDASVLISSPNLLNEFVNTSNDNVYAGKSSEMLFIRSSARTYLAGKLLNKVTSESFVSRESRRLVDTVAKMLELNGGRVKWVDEKRFGLKIGSNGVNESSLENEKMVYWSMDMGINVVQKGLEELDLWVIDGDSSCKGVFCHGS